MSSYLAIVFAVGVLLLLPLLLLLLLLLLQLLLLRLLLLLGAPLSLIHGLERARPFGPPTRHRHFFHTRRQELRNFKARSHT